jgi:hypothetical protein
MSGSKGRIRRVSSELGEKTLMISFPQERQALFNLAVVPLSSRSTSWDAVRYIFFSVELSDEGGT